MRTRITNEFSYTRAVWVVHKDVSSRVRDQPSVAFFNHDVRIIVNQRIISFQRVQQGEGGCAVNNCNILFQEVDAEDTRVMDRAFERPPEQIRYGLFECCLTGYDFSPWRDDNCVGGKG